jgi:hypothetical protein
MTSHVLTMLVALAYLGAGIFDPASAQRLWWQFGIAMLLLACLNIWLERRRG